VKGGKVVTVKHLISKLKEFDPDAVVIIGDPEGGWSNIDSVVQDGSSVRVVMDSTLPFSDE
jgi:hypothetical protein